MNRSLSQNPVKKNRRKRAFLDTLHQAFIQVGGFQMSDQYDQRGSGSSGKVQSSSEQYIHRGHLMP